MIDLFVLHGGTEAISMRSAAWSTADFVKGWVLVGPEALGGERELADWVSEGVAFARSLPPKG